MAEEAVRIRSESGERELQPPEEGAGAMILRDYWAVIKACTRSPQELMNRVKHQFEEFAPPDLVHFRRSADAGEALEVGDELEVDIKQTGTFRVRVTHADLNSITLGTLRGHPEAGRITFGAYRNDRGDVIFHIRSLARSGSRLHYAGFLIAGDPMQTYTWTDFVDCVAHTFGEGTVGVIHADVETVEMEAVNCEMDQPTFRARGN